MSDYINRDDALKAVMLIEERFDIFSTIKLLPAANVVERKKGRWKYNPIKDMQEAGFPDAWECSECRTTFPFYNRYCPGCGAEMERDEWDEWNMERWKRIRHEARNNQDH